MRSRALFQIQGILLSGIAATCWSMKECIDPIRASKKDELTCSSEFALVPDPICHNDETNADCLSTEGSDVCGFVLDTMFAEWKMLDAAFYTSGMCKADIKEGRFTAEDALNVLPANYEVVGVRLTGRDLLLALEQQLVAYFIHGNKEAYPHTAGLKYKLDLLQPEGERIKDAKLLGFLCNWKPLKEEDTYMILTNAALANSIFSRRLLEKSPTGRGEAEVLWTYATSVCHLKDNWHQMRVKHNPKKIPLDTFKQPEGPKRQVSSRI